ncbi:MAG: hypothetical protein K1X89_26405 [Myxococcaceae bacterium]|nr:hypothetical protein [Myxococcaceae bacterium]
MIWRAFCVIFVVSTATVLPPVAAVFRAAPAFWVAASLLVFLTYLMIENQLARRRLAESSGAAELWYLGRYAEALAEMEGTRGQGPAHPRASLQRAMLLLCVWRVGEAISALEDCLRGNASDTHVRDVARPYLAYANALMGNVEAFGRWKALAAAGHPACILGEGILACRRGDWAEAHRVLATPALGALGGPMRGLREALRVWAAARSGATLPRADTATIAAPGELDALRAVWPDAGAYLAEAG